MNKGSARRNNYWQWLLSIALLLFIAGIIVVRPLLANPPTAGTRILNRATAQYYIEGSTDLVTIQSNEVAAIVQTVEGLLLQQDQTVTGVPNTIVTLHHTLTNTGNADNSYYLTTANLTGDNFNLNALRLYQVDNAGAYTLVANQQAVPLTAGSSAHFAIQGEIPNNASTTASGAFARVQITATTVSGSLQRTNTDTITPTSNAPDVTISIRQTVSGTVTAGGDFTYTIDVSNIGPAATQGVVTVTYDVPSQLAFNASGSGGNGWTCTAVGQLVTCQYAGIVQPNRQAPALIVSVQANTVGTITNTVNVTVPNEPTGLLGNNTANTSTTIVAAALTPDLVITKNQTSSGAFILHRDYTYAINVTNVGGADTQGTVTVVDTLPTDPNGELYLTPIPTSGSFAPGNGWNCRVSGRIITCDYTNVIRAGEAALRLLLPVHANAVTPTPSNVVNTAIVSGGGEPATAVTAENTDTSDPIVIVKYSGVQGMVWLDNHKNHVLDSDERKLGGFVVELLCARDNIVTFAAPATGELLRGCYQRSTTSNNPIMNLLTYVIPQAYATGAVDYEVVATSITSDEPDDLGNYSINSVPPGEGYALRFKYPHGEQVVGTPINGDADQKSACANAGVITNLVLKEENVVVNQNLPLDPGGVVYDAVTRQPIMGAVVTITGPAGFDAETQTLGGVGTGNRVVMITDNMGVYQFMLINGAPSGIYTISVVANNYVFESQLIPSSGTLNHSRGGNCNGHYCVQPQSDLPTSNEPSALTYYLTFNLGPGDLDILNNHIPLDPAGLPHNSELIIEKTAARSEVELGDFLDYSVKITNRATALALPNVQVKDRLPFGFVYVAGTARLNGAKLTTEPTSRTFPVFAIGTMPADHASTLTYRVRIGPGSMQGNGVNEAQANSGKIQSNVSRAKVRVTAGVFTDDAFIIGKVFLDCNRNGVQDPKDLGIPGAKIILENGISVTTDSLGKYSLYGLSPRTHVLRLDTTTLPAGSKLLVISNRQAKRPNSRFADLSKGELHKANFAVAGCPTNLVEAVKKLQTAAVAEEEKTATLDNTVKTTLTADGKILVSNDTKALPAAGVVGTTAVTAQPMQKQGFDEVMPAATTVAPLAAQTPAPPLNTVARIARAPLETLMPDLDNTLDFVGMQDRDTLPHDQANIVIKGPEGSTLQLTVNGEMVSAKRVGKKAVLQSRQLEAWEYIGVDLIPGDNVLIASMIDQFGNPRGSKTIKVRAPDNLGVVTITVADTQYADGKTPVKVGVRLTDRNDIPITVRTPLTLESELGTWQQKDLNPDEPGTQVFLEGGQGEYLLLPPTTRGESRVRISSGTLAGEKRIMFLEPLRDMIAVGIVEGAFRMSQLSIKDLKPTRKRDGFQEEITDYTFGDGDKNTGGVRAAMYLKGKVKGEYLLTLAYDSTKKAIKDRLFRDIQPDEYYPVYGDGSIRSFDAQSNSRLYVRVDKGRSFVLYGDFTTQSDSEARVLSQYNRSSTGLKTHVETDWLKLNAFVSQDSNRQVIHEFPANGTTGPFFLPYASDMSINSEQVEVITRDRDQTSVIIKSETKQRYVDYNVDTFTGRLLFNAPVSSLDENLNPNFIRVTYEVNLGGVKFWLYGFDAQARVLDWLEVGVVGVRDEKPENPSTMVGINSTVRLGKKTYATGEVVQTDNLLTGKGQGERLELRHESDAVQARIQAGRTDSTFDNPSASLNKGRKEVAGKIDYRLAPSWRLKGEVLHTAEVTAGARSGGTVSIEHTFLNKTRIEFGLRHSEETTQPADPTTGTQVNDQLNSARVKVTVPILTSAEIYTEAETDLESTDRGLLALGGSYQFSSHGKAYARHEFISGISGPFSLNTDAKSNRTTVVGLETDYMKDGQLFSEYRGQSAFGGYEPEAALGLRNKFTLRKGLSLNTSLERVQALSDKKTDAKTNTTGTTGTTTTTSGTVEEATAATVGVEYTADPRWKGSARVEVRDGRTSDSILNTLGLAIKISQEWTFLGRSIYSYTDNVETSDTDQRRLQLGFAYRDAEDDFWHLLGRYEYRLDRSGGSAAVTTGTTTTSIPNDAVVGASDRRADIFSLHASYQANRRWIISGRYAFKRVEDRSNGIYSTGNGHLFGLRTTYDLARRWDVGLQGYILLDDLAADQYALGADVGYLVTENMWFSLGYNVFGFRDKDFDNMGDTDRGVYIQLRYKFDESDIRHVAWWDRKTETPPEQVLYAED